MFVRHDSLLIYLCYWCYFIILLFHLTAPTQLRFNNKAIFIFIITNTHRHYCSSNNATHYYSTSGHYHNGYDTVYLPLPVTKHAWHSIIIHRSSLFHYYYGHCHRSLILFFLSFSPSLPDTLVISRHQYDIITHHLSFSCHYATAYVRYRRILPPRYYPCRARDITIITPIRHAMPSPLIIPFQLIRLHYYWYLRARFDAIPACLSPLLFRYCHAIACHHYFADTPTSAHTVHCHYFHAIILSPFTHAACHSLSPLFH